MKKLSEFLITYDPAQSIITPEQRRILDMIAKAQEDDVRLSISIPRHYGKTATKTILDEYYRELRKEQDESLGDVS